MSLANTVFMYCKRKRGALISRQSKNIIIFFLISCQGVVLKDICPDRYKESLVDQVWWYFVIIFLFSQTSILKAHTFFELSAKFSVSSACHGKRIG